MAFLGWAIVQIAITWVAAPRGFMSIGTAIGALGLATEAIPLVLIVPTYLVIVRYLRNHVWFLMGLAIMAELLVIPGRTFGGEVMRGLVYLLAGYTFAMQFRTLAEEASADFRMAIAAIAVWFAVAGLCVFIPIQYAGGAAIASLPLASLALGMTGAAVVIMAAALLAQKRIFEMLAPIGRNWIAVALAAPLLFGALRRLLLAAKAAPTPAAADLVIGAAALAALVAAIGLAIFQSLGKRTSTHTRQDKPLPIRLH